MAATVAEMPTCRKCVRFLGHHTGMDQVCFIFGSLLLGLIR